METNLPSGFKQKPSDILTILLVEDNFLNRRMVKKVLEKNYIIKEAADVPSAEDILRLGTVHLAIIDIHLGNDKADGTLLGELINKTYDIPFIYLTAFGISEISQRAIATKPSAYITKPFKEVDLSLSIEIAMLKYLAAKPVKSNWILVKEGDYYVKLSMDSIDYLESSGNYLNVFSNNKCYKCRSTIKEMLDELPKAVFIQTHRAFIVNKNKIAKYNTNNVVINDVVIPLSEKFATGL